MYSADAARIVLGTVPLVPAAQDALSPAELAARLERYAGRARLRLPLFSAEGAAEGAADEPPADPRGVMTCWCCGARTAARRGLRKIGWRTRPFASPGSSVRHVECYCGPCFEEWGWPGGETDDETGGDP